MSHTLTQFKSQRDSVLQDAAGKLATADRDAFLTQAILQRYSKDRPREIVTDMDGNDTNNIGLPTGVTGATWEDDFSDVLRIEYPIAQIPPEFLNEEDWTLYSAPSGDGIMILMVAPSDGEMVRVTWTARHLADATTVPDPDFEAVCDYAASLCFAALSARYAQVGDPTVSADAVNYRSKGQEYAALAAAARKRYYEHVGVDPNAASEDLGAVGEVTSYRNEIAGGFDRLTHQKATR